MPTPDRGQVVNFLRAEITSRADLADEDLDNNALLSSLGLSSLDVVLISGALEDRFDIEVDPTMMYEFQTVNAVADCLSGVVLPPQANATPDDTRRQQAQPD